MPLSLIPRDSEIRILRGPLRGKKWIVGASTHGCWTGTYEVDNLAAFAVAIQPGACVYDVGANVGIYTMLACLRAGPTGKVCAFEPVERNLRYLRRHVALNGLENCHVVEAVVSDTEGIKRFSARSWENSMGRISSTGELAVRSVTLDNCVYGENRLPHPTIIKIDVEGAESLVLEGANRLFSEHHPKVFIEVHGSQQHADCRAYLAAKGYRLEEAYGRITASWAG